MGRAVITENRGFSLYKIKPLFETASLKYELNNLENEENNYATIILNAINSRDLLADDANIARDSVNAVLQQWIDGIIAAGDEEPDPIEPGDPNDPETGLPWVDPDRAQEAPLLALINAARTAASVGTVSRDDDLDDACLAHLRYQGGNGSMGHTGQDRSKPYDRANQQGYYRPAVIHELLAYGETTPARVMSRWEREPATWADLLADDVTHAGVAHVYARAHIGSYLWAVLLASAKGDPVTATVTEDPADAAAENTETALDAVKAPTPDKATPEKLGEAVRLFALAQNKLLIAQKELERIMAERLIRDSRIAKLESLLDKLKNFEPIDCWSCTYKDDLEINTEVDTFEIPGWYVDTPIAKTTGTMSWYERSINISYQTNVTTVGKLKPSEGMTDAAIAYNYAMESGHLKWRPAWRYGIISGVTASTCTVTLNAISARTLAGENSDMSLLDESVFSNVQILYPPCNGKIFIDGDEVVVYFIGQDRTKPVVIGFRREPRPCPPSRISWEQIQ